MTEPVLVNGPVQDGRARVKKLLMFGAAALFGILVVPKVLGGGGGADPTTTGVLDPSASTSTTVVVDAQDVLTIGRVSSKNPFTPLVNPVVETSPSVVAPTEPAATAEPATVDLPPLVEAPVEAPVESAPIPPSSAPRAPVRFGLVSVGTDGGGQPSAQVRVDGAVFDVVGDQDFGGSYRVLSLDPASRCGQFLFGDLKFSLCEGEETWT